jgi:hypothetical protein
MKMMRLNGLHKFFSLAARLGSEVYHSKSEVKFYSDSERVYTSPAALGRPGSPSPKPGTKAYAEGGFMVDPRNPAHKKAAARESWDVKDNPRNPYGPYMMRLKKNKREFHKEKNNLKNIYMVLQGAGENLVILHTLAARILKKEELPVDALGFQMQT